MNREVNVATNWAIAFQSIAQFVNRIMLMGRFKIIYH